MMIKKIKKAIVGFLQRLKRGGKSALNFSIRRLFFSSPEGRLNLYFLLKISFKNVIYYRSRTLVTVLAIALGTGAIVFLVSFAYGLQDVVTNRLIFPNATRLIDVQSASTALSLEKSSLEEITQISGVETAVPAINTAGILEYNQAKTDVVVIAAKNNYLEYANYFPLTGSFFSAEADANFTAHQEKINEIKDLIAQTEHVLGAAEEKKQIENGALINEKIIKFRINDEVYLPVRREPKQEAAIIGYARGSILNVYPAQEVWGGVYSSPGTEGKAYQDASGAWFGRWLKATLPLYYEQAPTFYAPLENENGGQTIATGYLPQVETHLLSPEEIIIEEELLGKKEELVLGEATPAGELTEEASPTSTSALTIIDQDKESTDEAELSALLEAQKTEEEKKKEVETRLAVVEVAREGGKEAIVSTGLISVWDLLPEDILGQEVGMEYVLSSGVISGLTGKVKSNLVSYKIVGVVQDDHPLVIVPLAELTSMGADRFTNLKVLAKNENSFSQIRTHIEALGFTTQSLNDTLIQVNKLFTVMRFLLGLFGMIALVVAIFGMFNTLTISLLERTREIGVIKTLGTTDRDVLCLFMIESLLIGFFGGIAGIFLGTLLGNLANLGFNIFGASAKTRLFVAPAGFLALIFVLAVVVGLATGLYPASRARKIKALDALRYE